MDCPFCGGDTHVVESRVTDEGKSVRRRRECTNCKKRFTTYEEAKETVIWVIKKDRRREPFDKNKVKKGVLRAVEKRSISLKQVDKLIDQLEQEMLRRQKEEVDSGVIGRSVLKRLKKLDKVAWLRFASVYLEFEDLDDFGKAVEK